MVFKLWIGLAVAISVLSEITEEEDVWVLTDENFQEALDLQPDLLVEFYAPWCGHCKKLAPEYSKAAKKLKANNPPIHIAKVDATVNSKLASKYKVEGYPTLKYFINKSPLEYSGGRTEDTIVSWVLKRNTPALSFSETLADLQSFIEKHKIVAVLFSQKETAEAKAFDLVSKAIESVTFTLSTDQAALIKYAVTEPAIVLFKQFDDKRVDYAGRYTQSDITKFIEDNRLPWVLPFGDDAIDQIFKKSTPALFLFANAYAEYQNDLETLSKELKGVLLVSYADLRAPDNGKLGEYLGVTPAAQPTAVIVDTRSGLQKFRLEGVVSFNTLKEFTKNWKNKKLEPYLKSEDIPANDFDNGVRVLVGKNFEQVAFDKTKDVLVEFYAPWCGHCKSLAPEYEKLAFELRKVDSVVIAKMDATANEANGVNIKGFPTIKFYPANNKNPVEFEGERNFEGLLKFVNEKASIKFDGPSKIDL